jgi:uncharacterized protein YprB with RNaseH-like and TPR domain
VKILFFDLETSPITAHTWGLWQQNVSINQIIQSTEVICFGARWYGQKKVTFRSVHHHGKLEMLKTLHAMMDEADVLVGWNSKAFDHKHVNREFVEAGFWPPSPTKDLDLMTVVKSRFKFPSNKLDYVAQQLGVGAKVQHSGFDLWVKCMAGDRKAWSVMRQYQIQDVDLLVDLYEILKPWMGAQHPNAAAYIGRPDACIVCGSDQLVIRGKAVTNTGSYKRYLCKDCGKWQRGKTAEDTTNNRNL